MKVTKKTSKMNKKLKQPSKVKTTGHEWDGIKEYDKPDPYGLRVLFYAAVIFSLIYWILYPSFPVPGSLGILEETSQQRLKKELQEIQAVRDVYQKEFDKASFEEIFNNKDLMKFALRGGESAFNNNCAPCHQIGGGGAVGYPNLTAGAWLWGGTVEDIYQTLLYGIRSGHEEARDSVMAAFGKDGILTEEQIKLLVPYVKSLSNGQPLNSNADALFQAQCASCHGKNGEGGYDFGAPNLRDAIWLYGQSDEEIFKTIYHGRAGVMPFWQGKLTDSTIRQLSVYVHQLGGGEINDWEKEKPSE